MQRNRLPFFNPILPAPASGPANSNSAVAGSFIDEHDSIAYWSDPDMLLETVSSEENYAAFCDSQDGFVNSG